MKVSWRCFVAWSISWFWSSMTATWGTSLPPGCSSCWCSSIAWDYFVAAVTIFLICFVPLKPHLYKVASISRVVNSTHMRWQVESQQCGQTRWRRASWRILDSYAKFTLLFIIQKSLLYFVVLYVLIKECFRHKRKHSQKGRCNFLLFM